MRAFADLDNYRKRSLNETARQIADARAAVVRDWLEVVDSVERAVRTESEGPYYEGLRAVLDQMDAVLARQGVDRIGAPANGSIRSVTRRSPSGRQTTSRTARSSRSSGRDSPSRTACSGPHRSWVASASENAA
jgi:hypothetical protein